MDPFHANYPFLDASQEVVREADIGPAEAIRADETDETRHPAVERGVQRVERALLEGTVDIPEGQRHPGVRIELLSYPVARILVSLLDEPGVIDKYTNAEAETAYKRFTEDFDVLDDKKRLPENGKVPLQYFLHEFGLASQVEQYQSGFLIAVTHYLRLSSNLEGKSWTLATRQLRDGKVTISREELYELLQEAIRQRISDGLPPEQIPEEIKESLSDEISEIKDEISEIDIQTNIDVIAPDCFPPCITSLVEQAQDGATLTNTEEFTLVSFFASLNSDTDELQDFCGANTDTSRVEYIRDESGAQYAPPSCETMAAYGECPVADEEDPTVDARCDSISHPLAYYEDALDDAGQRN
ncbi:DNA primase large subunit PriL [Halorussus ruber]|uniref:DNA primase large subunit PriL n=1 Tax=Halorussus ruber TaxID=1126238 RepID=UPI001092D45C|nr:DNA primase large subunit PriL [Halorussus ruber]